MNWKCKSYTAVLLLDYGSVTGYFCREGNEPADCHRTSYRVGVSGNGAWGLGHMVFSWEHICSYSSFVSFISDACLRGRRHQIIFHDRRNTYNWRAVQVHGVYVLSGRACSVFCFDV